MYGNQHDIHNADSSYKKRNPRYKRDKSSYHSQHLIQGFHYILKILHLEIILSCALVSFFQKMNNLIRYGLRIHSGVNLHSHGVKEVHISYQLIHSRIRDVH